MFFHRYCPFVRPSFTNGNVLVCLAEEVEKLELKTEVKGDLKKQSTKKRGKDVRKGA